MPQAMLTPPATDPGLTALLQAPEHPPQGSPAGCQDPREPPDRRLPPRRPTPAPCAAPKREAFRNAKELNLNQFLHELEDRANVYMEKLSAKDFHGLVRLIKMADGNTVIKLYSSNKTEIKNPSGSQETIKYISVLFAISDFTHQKRDEDYPLIFDAATSSFGEAKEQDFYNVIDNIKKQCIIVTKDFISDGEIRQDDINKLSCSVYRIKKAENFNASDLSTIRTKVTKIR